MATLLEKIQNFRDSPELLEDLYHQDPKAFSEAFQNLPQESLREGIFRFWHIRLTQSVSLQPSKTYRVEVKDILVVIGLGVLSWCILFKLKFEPLLSGSLVMFSALSCVTLFLERVRERRILLLSVALLLLLGVLLSFSFGRTNGAVLTLIEFHFPLLMWVAYGLVFSRFDIRKSERFLEYVRYNGDLLTFSGLVLIGGVFFSYVTVMLFLVIGLDITSFYMENIATLGIVLAPFVAAFVIRKTPFVSNTLVPILANLFTPLAFVVLVVYLFSLPFGQKNIFEDRYLLLVFDAMLFAVMSLILFSLSEKVSFRNRMFQQVLLLSLSLVAILLDGIGLSAILYRIGEYGGITPNRLAVLGFNVLLLAHLCILAFSFFSVFAGRSSLSVVEKWVVRFFPVYIAWILFVIIGFPILFGWDTIG